MTPITIKASSRNGYFLINDVDYPKGHFCLKYDNLSGLESEINFSLCNIYDNVEIISSRGFAEIVGVESWNELLLLLKNLSVLHGTSSNDVINADLSGRQGLKTIFGDSIVGIRKASIAAQFQYGIEEGTADSEIVGSGSISIVESLLVMSSGTDVDGKAAIESVETVRYVPGQETFAMFTLVFSTPQLNSIQRGGLFDSENGFFVSYDIDGKFYFVQRRDGVDSKQEIVLTEFLSKYGYNFDPTKGNIYRISYGYLGFAPITLEVVRPEGGFALLAKIEYPNLHEVTHTIQTFLPIRGEVENVGNNTDIILKSGSLAAGITNGGTEDIAGRRFTWANDATFIFTGNVTLVAFHNKTTFQSLENRVPARLLFVSGANDSNKVLRWRLYKNPIFSVAGTWNDVDINNSTLEYSEDAVVDYAADNDLFLAWNTGTSADFFEQVEELLLDLPPDGYAAFAILNAATNAEADLSIRWSELF